MARPREFDPNQVLQTAINLFWERGYAAASVDELVRQSGVAKYGIYGTFGSKRALFKKALTQYALDRHQDIQRPIRKPGAALSEIRDFFQGAVKLMTQAGARRGCLIVNTGVELGLRDAEMRDFVAHFFRETEDVMARCLAHAQKLGQVEVATNISALAVYLVTEFRTALMLAGSGATTREIQTHLEMALQILG